ncbi:hypothetical protein GALMADRAFT_246325 [Galerina marginata CBS 339.88]|uniref:F-box domain-containing protein n=1 Tax=Galerina marginata (strain CBS 339.88) TaxID=685588 RepID=A0A067T1Q6_GALM3|nr:hypothetical protein GALMADRAFT_246325 [Galerina marginata CBS 339.88]
MALECPVMRSPLSLYLTNNHSPSDEEVIKAQELKQIPSAKLAKVEDLILQTQHTLDALYEERNALKSSIARCNTILSPIRRVPQDVWREIFFHCLATHRNPIMSYAEAPLLLTHICNLWRSIALSTPEIWSRIYIPIFYTIRDPIFDLPPTHVDNPGIFGLTDKMQQRCDLIREWLGRAGAVPLSVALSTQSGELPTELHHQLFDIVFHSSPRFRNLDLTLITMGEAHHRAMDLSVDKFLNLEELRIYSIRNDSVRWYECGIFSAPRLRKLSIGYLPGAGPSAILFPIPSTWSQLSSLSIRSFMPSQWACQLLLHCPLLVQCTLKVKGAMTDNTISDSNDSQKIHMVNLMDLATVEEGNSAASIYRVLHAPILRNLECIETRSSHLLQALPSALKLLPRLEGLFKLTLSSRVLTMDEAFDCFRFVPSVVHLCIGHKTDKSPTIPLSPKNHNLQVLLSTYPSEESPNQDLLILPRLEILEIYGVSISDKDLLDFIIMRLDPKQQCISRLKHLMGTFTRVKQMDISRQVEYHARKMGVEFKLDLSWVVKDLEAGLSPSHCLANDYPWRF